jgi:hypothetical protein
MQSLNPVESAPRAGDPDAAISAVLDRIAKLTASVTDESSPAAPQTPPPQKQSAFMPIEPASFGEAGLTDTEIEALILKFLLARGDATGHDIADQVRFPFMPVSQLLNEMKYSQLVGHRGSAPMNDFVYQLTDLGRERARRYTQHCTYFGAAPVSLEDYVASVHAQSLTGQNPTAEDLLRAFDGLLLGPRMLDRLGPAISSGRGLFLFGPPGNGKSSIAERITAAFGQEIWVPRAIGVDGEILRLYDPMNHVEAPLEKGAGLLDSCKCYQRWIRIRRPTIVVGGELTMSQLDVTINMATGISEAPLQLKSNCGTLVIDDFGRQRMRIDELLNRWIVPLEKRCDFLNLANGKKIQVPFDQLVVFSTNLEPRELVDEAFLRRIPYKIEVIDPTEDEFQRLFALMADRFGVAYGRDAVDRLIAKHFKAAGRPLRFCHPRDLLLQIVNYCKYQNRPAEMTDEYFDRAVENYFAVM